MPHTKMEKLLMDPEKFFTKVAKEELGETWRYLAYWALLPSLVAAILVGFMGVTLGGYIPIPNWLGEIVLKNTALFGLALGVASGLAVYVGIFIGLIATAVVAHAVAMLFKGKGKFDESLKAVIYGASPFYAFGWLPIFGVLFGLYSVIVQVPAFQLLHRVRFHKAVCIILGTLFLIGLLVGVLPFLGGILGTGYHFGIVVNSIRGIVGLILA